jgi:hypothetical protein
VWVRDFKKNPEFVGEDRPACIVMKVPEDQEDSLQAIGGSAIEPGDVIILPITTSPPRPGDTVIELSPDEKRICRLDPAACGWRRHGRHGWHGLLSPTIQSTTIRKARQRCRAFLH